MGKKLVSNKNKNGKTKIWEKDEEFIYIPILESVEQLLSNKCLVEIIFTTEKRQENVICYNISVGIILKEDQYYQEKQNNSLQIILYHDEVEDCNPLSSHAGVHKIDMLYYNLPNIFPIFRSKHCAVRLYPITNAKLIKKYGIESILATISDGINKLYNYYPMKKGDQETIVFGKNVHCLVDTLGQHYYGGFKERVGCIISKMQTMSMSV